MKKSIEKSKKYLELITGSSFLFILTGYIFGYSIFTAFLNAMFGLPILTTVIFPPNQILFLGYLVMFSLFISIFVYFQFQNTSMGFRFEQLVFIGLVFWLLGSNYSFKLFSWNISSTLVKIFGTILIFTIFIIYYKFIKYIKKIKKKERKKKDKDIGDFFGVVWLVYLLALLLPFLSSNTQHVISGKTNIISIVSVFYFELFYTISLILILYRRFVKEIKYKKNNNLISYLTLIATTLLLLYQLSSIIGEAIAKSYISKSEGVFSSASLQLNKKIEISENEKTDSIDNLFLLSKDSNSYHFFQLNPNKMFIIESDIVNYVVMPAK